MSSFLAIFFFFQAEDGIRDYKVTGVQTCALPISAAQEAAFRAAGIPIRGRITGEGTVEGGDVCWIDERTLAVGRGYRTNDAGIRQLRDPVRDCVDEVVVVPLPHWHGPGDGFHPMSTG